MQDIWLPRPHDRDSGLDCVLRRLVQLAVAWHAAAQQLGAGQTTEQQSSNDSGVTRLTACRICGGTALKAMRWTLVQHQRQDRPTQAGGPRKRFATCCSTVC